MPEAAINVINKAGINSKTELNVGVILKNIISPIKTIKANPKSIKPTSVDASGSKILGKYTFVTTLWLSTKLLLARVSDWLKKFQKSSPVKLNIA